MFLAAVSTLFSMPLKYGDLANTESLQSFYTALIVCLNVIASGGGSNLFPPDQLQTFTPHDIQERIKGSKIVLVSEQVLEDFTFICLILLPGSRASGHA